MELKDYLNMNPVDYSDEELTQFMEKLEEIHKNLIDAWASEIDDIPKDADFESKKVKKLVKEISKAYAPDVARAEYLAEIVGEELNKRLNHLEQLASLGQLNGDYKEDTEEFIERELERTRQIREQNDLDD